MEVISLLDYEHAAHGARCNGVISTARGRLEATWTYDLGGVPVSRTVPVAPGMLAELWSGITASLASQGVFWRCLVNDPTRPLDPETDHLVVAVVVRGGTQHCLTFAVPADETALDFTGWLARLGVPDLAVPAIAAE